jgi:hypothetical protein
MHKNRPGQIILRTQLRRKLLTALASATVVACAMLLGPAGSQEQLVITNLVTQVALRSGPVTVTLSPRPTLRQALQAARRGDGTITLVIEGIEGTLTQPVRINVFLDKPDANSATPVDDPHFLGYIYVAPSRGRVNGAGRAFDVTTAEAVDPATPLQVTLAPVTGTNMAPREAMLQVGRIYMRRET